MPGRKCRRGCSFLHPPQQETLEHLGKRTVVDAIDHPDGAEPEGKPDHAAGNAGAPQPALNNRRIYSAAGRGTGGGSLVYHMMHVRARPSDLDNWAYNGCSGWSFQDCLPSFQRLENQLDDTNPTAGKGGPITVVNAKDTGNPVSQAFLDACVELGYPLVDDFNASTFGCGWHHLDLRDGRRGGVLTSYLQPALARGNITLKTGARATRLLLENNRCVGVEYLE